MLNDFIDNLPLGYMAINGKAEVLQCNKQALELFDIALEEILEQNIWTVLPELSSTCYRPVNSAIKNNQAETVSVYYSRLNKWLELTIKPEQPRSHLFIKDVSAQHRITLDMKLFKAVVQNSADAVVITNNMGNILLANHSTETLFGYQERELLNKNVSLLMKPSEAGHHEQYMAHYLRSGNSGIIGVGPRELVARHKDGKSIEIELAISEFHSDDKYYFVGNMRDITVRKELQRKLEQMAGHDTLTGLPNRSLLFDRAQQAISFSFRHKQNVALLFIDLDGFKDINDNYGHKAGDVLIKTMANRMNKTVRQCDTVARIGGDEFVILLTNNKHKKHAGNVANKILAQLNLPVKINEISMSVSGSIGIASYPEDGDDLEALLGNADKAMYQAKNSGKNKATFWSKTD